MPMGFKREEIKHLLTLSRIKLEEAELKSISQDLERIISYVAELSELNTENIEPLSGGVDFKALLREDNPPLHKDIDEAKKLIESAPLVEDNYIKVPRILE
jgi:aspartyl-tRNA(Asn)/glutamyl-tRNA(Gln) amidotransferase subunit C